MKHTRERYQQGSLRTVKRKSGAEVWEYRYRDHTEAGSPLRQMTFPKTKYPTEAKVRIALQAKLLEINGPERFTARVEPTLGVVVDRFIQDERIAEILAQPPGEVIIHDGLAFSTATNYRSLIRTHIRPKWGDVRLSEIKPLEVRDWLKGLKLKPKSKNSIKNLLHLLFDRAMLMGLLDVERNPMELVKVKGGSKRDKEPAVLSPEEFQTLVAELKEPHSVMVTVAMCTGLRIGEVLALRWDCLDFDAGVMKVKRSVYQGRVGRPKTEESKATLPLDGAFAQVLLAWRQVQVAEDNPLVFPSPITGRCYHAGMLMKNHIKPASIKVGLPAIGWHSFRHSYRGLLDDTGANTGTQQGLMRHANVSTTMNVYGRASMKAKQAANSKVVQMILAPRAA